MDVKSVKLQEMMMSKGGATNMGSQNAPGVIVKEWFETRTFHPK